MQGKEKKSGTASTCITLAKETAYLVMYQALENMYISL